MENEFIKCGKGILAFIREQEEKDRKDKEWLNSLSKEERNKEINKRLEKYLEEDSKRVWQPTPIYMGIKQAEQYQKLIEELYGK